MPKKQASSRKKKTSTKKSSGAKASHTFSSKPLIEGVVDDLSTAAPKKTSATKRKKGTYLQKKAPRKATKKEQAKKIEEELTQIYENEDGSLPDMKSFEKRTGGWMIRAFGTLLLSLVFVSAVAWFGYTKFQAPSGTFVEDDVILSIGGEEQIAYGDDVRYRVRFKNAQTVPLAGATIEVRYPAGFVFATSSIDPDAGADNVWTLGKLADGEGAFIDISGALYGDVGEAQSFRVFLSYTPGNFSSTFQKVATQETTIVSTPLEVALSAPSEVAQGTAAEFVMTVTQADDATFPDNIALVFDPGAPFAMQSMEPQSDDFQDLTWSIDQLGEEENVFALVGAFAGGAESITSTAKIIGWQEDQSRNDAYVIGMAEHTIVLADEQLSVQLVANGSQQDITVQPGENVSASVLVKNNTQDVLKDVRVRLIFDAPSLNNRSIMYWQGVEDDADGSILGEQLSDTVRRGQITWTDETISALSALDPGEEVTIDVLLPVKTAEQTDLAGYETHEITLASDVQFDAIGSQETAAAVPLILTINSDAGFEVRSDVDNSVHVITWLLSNSFHPLKDIEAKVDIYGDITFDPEDATVPAGEIEYDAEEQQLVWQVTEMPLSLDVLALQFPVELNQQNPSQTQLTSKVTITAIDAVTEKPVLLIGDEIGL